MRRHSVRVIGLDGTDLGVMTIEAALRLARDAGLEIAEVDTKADPTVCKIMDAEEFEAHLRATQGPPN